MKTNRKKKFREQFGRAFQTKLVRLMYQEPSFISVIRPVIKYEYFETKRLQWFVGRLYYAYDQGDRATRAFLRRELKEHLEYGTIEEGDVERYRTFIARLTREVPDKNYMQKKVGEFTKHAKLRTGLYKAAVALEQDADVEKALEEVHALDTALKQTDAIVDPSEFKNYMRRIVKRGPPKLTTGIPTGWDSLDRAMGGHMGLPLKRLGCIMAGTGSGKTLTLTQLGATALRHFASMDEHQSVLHLSGEDDFESMVFRYQAHLMNLPFKIVKNKRYLKDIQKKYRRLNRTLGRNWEDHLIVKEINPDELCVADIEAMLHQLDNEGYNVKLVVIDYMDLIRPNKERRSDQNHDLLGNAYKDCRGMLKRMNKSGWTASQIKAEHQGAKEVRINAGAGAIKKAFVSDVVLGIEQTDKEKARGKGRCRVNKLRFGKDKFRFDLAMDYECQRIEDLGQIQEDDDE